MAPQKSISYTIKALPAPLHRRLKGLAATHGRSLNQEIIAQLEAATTSQRVNPETFLAEAARLRASVGLVASAADIDAFKREGRS